MSFLSSLISRCALKEVARATTRRLSKQSSSLPAVTSCRWLSLHSTNTFSARDVHEADEHAGEFYEITPKNAFENGHFRWEDPFDLESQLTEEEVSSLISFYVLEVDSRAFQRYNLFFILLSDTNTHRKQSPQAQENSVNTSSLH